MPVANRVGGARLHVGISALQVVSGGLLPYLQRLIADPPRDYPDVDYTFFVNEKVESKLSPGGPNASLRAMDSVARRTITRVAWEQLVLPLEVTRRRIDVLYHLSAYDLPLARCPVIISVSNMAPFEPDAIKLEPRWYRRWRLHLLRYLSRHSSYTADAANTHLESLARHLVEHHGLSPARTIGINCGVEIPTMEPGEASPVAVTVPFILLVATLTRYKVIETVIEGYGRLLMERGTLPDLLIAGPTIDREYRMELEVLTDGLGLASNVGFLGHVRRGQLHRYMATAMVTVFPSIVEALGVTLIEEMLVGSTLIVTRASGMPALCGDAVVYYEPFDPGSFADALARLLEDPALRAGLRVASAARARAFDLDSNQGLHRLQELFVNLAAGRSIGALGSPRGIGGLVAGARLAAAQSLPWS